jgi:hypothetical protein
MNWTTVHTNLGLDENNGTIYFTGECVMSLCRHPSIRQVVVCMSMGGSATCLDYLQRKIHGICGSHHLRASRKIAAPTDCGRVNEALCSFRSSSPSAAAGSSTSYTCRSCSSTSRSLDLGLTVAVTGSWPRARPR